MPDLTYAVVIGYTNYKGVFAERRIRPIRVYWGYTKWHPHPQWLLEAHDFSKAAVRDFAMKDITFWRPVDA